MSYVDVMRVMREKMENTANYDNGAKAPGKKTKTKTNKSLQQLLKRAVQDNKRLKKKLRKRKTDKMRISSSAFICEPNTDDPLQCSTMEEAINPPLPTMTASLNSWAVASMNVPPFTPDEGEDDISRRSFETWRDLLEASLALVGIVDEAAKMNVFKVKAGSKLLEILEDAPATSLDSQVTPYSGAMDRLKAFFGSREYSLTQRQKLRSMVQQQNEQD
ncbi:uncharacterized protein LOC125949000 [Anopheles darlingi]|uniref:uncharacterized protein LOC125949000 n=1 Tax=Anopheles darlingi TaxID=43151 RepID=UPI00210029C7|nr:uncharacterized protein LOC125949000 [Anopheles darlingi]